MMGEDAADSRPAGSDLASMMRSAERLDSLVDTAELMGDLDGADRFRELACRLRLAAMELLDD